MSALNDKIVIVTGGSSGIGRAAALNFAKKGAKVVIAGRHTVPLAIAAGPTESGALTGMMGLSPEQAAAIKEQERERIPLKRRGNPNDVARWIVSPPIRLSDG